MSHKLKVIYHISTYSIWEFNNPTDTSAENVTLCGGLTELEELKYLCIYTLYYFEFDVKIINHIYKLKLFPP